MVLLVCNAQDRSLQIIEVDPSSAPRVLLKETKHSRAITAVTASNNPILVATGSIDKTINIWKFENVDVLSTPMHLYNLLGHEDFITSLAFLADGSILASSSNDHTVRLWSTSTGEVIRALPSHTDSVRCVRFSPAADMLASSGGNLDPTISLWRLSQSDYETSHYGMLIGHTASVDCFDFSPHASSTLVSCSYDRSIRLWNTTSQELICCRKSAHNGFINFVQFLPDGSQIVSASGGDFTVNLWSTHELSLLRVLSPYLEGIKALCLVTSSLNDGSGRGGDGTYKGGDDADRCRSKANELVCGTAEGLVVSLQWSDKGGRVASASVTAIAPTVTDIATDTASGAATSTTTTNANTVTKAEVVTYDSTATAVISSSSESRNVYADADSSGCGGVAYETDGDGDEDGVIIGAVASRQLLQLSSSSCMFIMDL